MNTALTRKLVGLTLISLISGGAQADECLQDWWTKLAPIVGKSDSGLVADRQANNTWDDWVWRGPTFYCNPTGGACTYAYNKSQTTGYSWAVGGSVEFGGIPIVGGVVSSFEANGTYTSTKSWTEGFTWTQNIRGGQSAQPVQVVRRRWKQGHFRGADRLIVNSNCNDGNSSWYWWDGNATFGKWSANVEESRFVMYHIW